MNKHNLTRVKDLTGLDTKPVELKCLKLMEEAGEVAQELLPLLNGCGTTHRSGSRLAVIKECLDTIICALSVAYELEATDEELDFHMACKINKWEANTRHSLGLKGVEQQFPDDSPS